MRIAQHGSTLYFQYWDGSSRKRTKLNQVEKRLNLNPIRYETIAANNVAMYGATELTSSIPVNLDYVRFNRIDDYLTGVERPNVLLEEFALSQNYPNPFNPETVIRYRHASLMEVKLQIFNNLGQRVHTLVDRRHQPGFYTVYWDGHDDTGLLVASGVYFYRLSAGEFKNVRRMTLLR